MRKDDIRQSRQYAQYMHEIGWKGIKVGMWYAYVRQFPLVGSFIKIPRIKPPVPFEEIESLAKRYRAFRVVIEFEENHESRITNYETRKYGYKRSKSIYSPTKTIHIDLTASENEIFRHFREAKRRAVRRAVKNGVVVKESDDIEQFIRLKKKQDFVFGFLIRNDLRALWDAFAQKNAITLLAYKKKNHELRITNRGKNEDGEVSKNIRASKDREYTERHDPIAGVLLLFHNGVSYYWQAASTKKGKKLQAPSLLVWEALKTAKKKGYKRFDFEGIYDDRFPQATKNWKGFTRFKEGFGGKEIDYPQSFVR